ncbi:MAG: hypothetical protein ABSB73_06435 [Solirubrobacteraceae bacterium]
MRKLLVLITVLLLCGGASLLTAGAAVSATAGGQSVRAVWPLGARTVWVWTQTDALVGAQALERSTDGGEHWINATPNGLRRSAGDHVISGFFALDAEHAWVVYGSVASAAEQTIASTSDGGLHWTVVGRRPGSYGCDLQFVSPKTGWCTLIGAALGSESVKLYRTGDGGRHWRVVSDSSPDATAPGSLPFGCDKNIQFTSVKVGWAVFYCADGAAPLYETTDGGATWVRRDIGGAAGRRSDEGAGFTGSPVLNGADGAVGYTIAPSRTVVCVTTDAGASWASLTPPGQAKPWVVDVITALRWRLVAGDEVLATNDGGRTWTAIHADVSFNLGFSFASPAPPSVDFATGEIGWIVTQAPAGESLWRTIDGGSTWRPVVVPGT